jgi:hypothetical protein
LGGREEAEFDGVSPTTGFEGRAGVDDRGLGKGYAGAVGKGVLLAEAGGRESRLLLEE